MRATIRYYHDQITVPDDAKLGDRFVFTATAIVTELEQTLENVTSYARNPDTDPEILSGEQRATITLTNALLA